MDVMSDWEDAYPYILEELRNYKKLIVKQLTLAPDEEWQPYVKSSLLTDESKDDIKKCTCGIEAIGGGIHSDWCDKGE